MTDSNKCISCESKVSDELSEASGLVLCFTCRQLPGGKETMQLLTNMSANVEEQVMASTSGHNITPKVTNTSVSDVTWKSSLKRKKSTSPTDFCKMVEECKKEAKRRIKGVSQKIEDYKKHLKEENVKLQSQNQTYEKMNDFFIKFKKYYDHKMSETTDILDECKKHQTYLDSIQKKVEQSTDSIQTNQSVSEEVKGYCDCTEKWLDKLKQKKNPSFDKISEGMNNLEHFVIPKNIKTPYRKKRKANVLNDAESHSSSFQEEKPEPSGGSGQQNSSDDLEILEVDDKETDLFSLRHFLDQEHALHSVETVLFQPEESEEEGEDMKYMNVSSTTSESQQKQTGPSTSVSENESNLVTVGQLREDLRYYKEVWVKMDLHGQPRCGRIVQDGTHILLHAFKDGFAPAAVKLYEYEAMKRSFDMNAVFLDLGWGAGSKGKVFISLDNRNSVRKTRFKELCSGEKGPSYSSSSLLYHETQKNLVNLSCLDRVWGGVSEANNRRDGDILKRSRPNKYPVSVSPGSVIGGLHAKTGMANTVWVPKVSDFAIYTSRAVKQTTAHHIGTVQEGLNIVDAAAEICPITNVSVMACGLVIA